MRIPKVGTKNTLGVDWEPAILAKAKTSERNQPIKPKKTKP
jgi:hypothetical protein